MEKFVSKPNELQFLQRMAQVTNDEERKKIEQEYDTQVKAYFDWMDTIKKENLDNQ
jgi:hypothetical protein